MGKRVIVDPDWIQIVNDDDLLVNLNQVMYVMNAGDGFIKIGFADGSYRVTKGTTASFVEAVKQRASDD